MRDQVGAALCVVVALSGCHWLSTPEDRPEIRLDDPSAVSPGSEYHLRGTKLTITNVDFDVGDEPVVRFRVANGDSVGQVHLRRTGPRESSGGYGFALEAIDVDKQRAVITIHH